MADFCDEATALTEAHIERSLRERRAKTLEMPFSGSCLSCSEPVPSTGPDRRRFCDAECRQDWENERRRRFGITR